MRRKKQLQIILPTPQFFPPKFQIYSQKQKTPGNPFIKQDFQGLALFKPQIVLASQEICQ